MDSVEEWTGGMGLNDVVDAAAGGCDEVVGQQASGGWMMVGEVPVVGAV